MGIGSAAQFLRSAATAIVMLGILGVAFGESVVDKANYWKFLAIESYPSFNLMDRDKLVSEKYFRDEGGAEHRVFVFESNPNGDQSTCRVVVTDENYRVTSSWNSNRVDRLLNVGFMEHTSPPVLEIVRHDSSRRELVCEHLCLHLGVLQAFSYQRGNLLMRTE